MKIRKFLCLSGLLFSLVSIAQENVERVNIRISNANFDKFVQQIEAQSELHIYYDTAWFSGKKFSYAGDSVDLEEAIYEVLKGTGLLFNRIDPQRLLILPQKRLNMTKRIPGGKRRPVSDRSPTGTNYPDHGGRETGLISNPGCSQG